MDSFIQETTPSMQKLYRKTFGPIYCKNDFFLLSKQIVIVITIGKENLKKLTHSHHPSYCDIYFLLTSIGFFCNPNNPEFKINITVQPSSQMKIIILSQKSIPI